MNGIRRGEGWPRPVSSTIEGVRLAYASCVRTLIVNGTVVSSASSQVATVVIESGTVVAVRAGCAEAESDSVARDI